MVIALCLILSGWSKFSAVKARATTEVVTCQKQAVRQRSPILRDSVGHYRAVAEIVQRASSETECRVLWNLRISKSMAAWRSIEILDDEGDFNAEHEFEIMGFTPDNKSLVLRIRRSEGDSDVYVLAVLTLATMRFHTYDLQRFLRGSKEENCPVNLVPEGITPNGRIVVRPYSVEDLEPPQKPCIGQATWIYDPRSLKREFAPNPPIVRLEGSVDRR